jgi:hypothetical protein
MYNPKKMNNKKRQISFRCLAHHQGPYRESYSDVPETAESIGSRSTIEEME